ncbi:inverse autotransporter beta domain-containing protein, partial [Desulfovibrio sp. OttesenSCG-928-M14]|nr:inverse autotransporter beta domain-containing protein [Desulfovibrio sp. OttesenSCG-928-M14]
MAIRNRDKEKNPSRFFCFMVWLVICTLFLPAPLAVNAASAQSQDMLLAEVEGWNRHIHERLNSAERRAAIAEAARKEAENASAIGGHDRNAGKDSSVSASVNGISDRVPELRDKTTTIAQQPEFGDTTRNGKTISVMSPNSSPRPQSVGEVLFNHAASFMGVPGLTPSSSLHSGSYGLDEGLGFHQDGAVRKAGGTTSGPSDRGQRAQAYMRSGIQGEAGPGYASTIWEPGYDAATGTHWRGDPTRGGRISAFSGSQSRNLDDFDPLNMALDRGLNFGNSFINSMGEAAISGLVDGGRARLNFYFDKDGYFAGEGDALLPFYDSTHTTIFTQLGARSMSAEDTEDRWIGNFGLGQRWFPAATEEDAGNWMIGYNAFFDYDFTRDHQRGGVGLEAQYDWLRLASNYYFPLSNWKGSEDFDSRFVKERPAEGWDVRMKGYLPFYRNIAITGAYTQWYGDNVGMFGASELEKDPRVWSYGIEYTPIPLVSGFITQKSTERGRTDTEFGLNLTYHFNMPWEEQTSHAKVAELRTVGGSRHEFVDRENRIILEYKAKNNYHIEYLGPLGGNRFLFRVVNGFGEFAAGQTVQVSTGGAWLAEVAPAQPQSLFAQAVDFLDELISVKAAWAGSSAKSYTTNGQGQFVVQLDPGALPTTGTVTVTATVGNSSASFTLIGSGGGGSGGIVFQATSGGTAFSTHTGTTATFTVLVQDSSGVNVPDGTVVTWYVASTSLSKNLAVASTKKGTFDGLTLGSKPVAGTDTTVTSTTTGGKASINLIDILGERDVTVTASVSSDSATSGAFTFGKGPLGNFALGYPDSPDKTVIWSDAIAVCGGGAPTLEAVKKYYSVTKLPGVETTDGALATLFDIGGGLYKPMRDAADLPTGYVNFWSGRAQGSVPPKVDAVNLTSNYYDAFE